MADARLSSDSKYDVFACVCQPRDGLVLPPLTQCQWEYVVAL